MPLMSSIRDDAELAIYRDEKGAPEMLRVHGGFAEVSETGLTVLAEGIA
jgi:F-type H+-transporting ATPase subunit epsilon